MFLAFVSRVCVGKLSFLTGKMLEQQASGRFSYACAGEEWLAIANFGDRLGAKQAGVMPRYEALSSLWRWGTSQGQFEKVAEVTTYGATDWEHFHLDGLDYLAVSNEGNVQQRQHQTSVIYRLDPGCTDKAAE
jgi:hypothetical protein